MVTVANPFQQDRCPFCDNLYYVGECAIVSSVTGDVLREYSNSVFARTFVKELKGPEYARKLALRKCPHCNNLLPRTRESYTIAIVGDSSSGKSHYIASLIQQLKQRAFLQLIGCTRIVGQGTGRESTDERYRRDYYDPLYVVMQPMPPNAMATSGIMEPLVYEMVFSEQSGLGPSKSVNLLFYDSSGEDLAQQDRMVQYGHYVLSASAIIFLADPLTMPGIVKELPLNLRAPVNRPASTAEVLNRVVQTLEQSQGLNPGAPLKTPIAITVSKSDLLQYVTKYGPPPLFLSDSNYTNMLDTRVFNMVSDEVQKLLQVVGDQVLVPSTASFMNKSFFAVSATGFSPDKVTNKYPGIEPMRCLDPLLWALWKLDVIAMR